MKGEQTVRPITEEFGINVRNRRHLLKLSQEELADRAQLDRKTIGNIETGKANPELLTMELIATALDTSISELLIVD